MDAGGTGPDIGSSRLSREECATNFSDAHPPLNTHEAAVEAGRCYFCHDAPCVTACPTGIDIPSFIRKISTGNLRGSARTILEANIFGAMCARVCPTEILCEGACVRNTGDNRPVQIGALQRVATDHALAGNIRFFERAPATGKRVAVVGAGPAGLSCAHGLARLGHDVTVFDAHEKPGGLNEYGIAAYKVVDGIAAREVEYILGLGGIRIEQSQRIDAAGDLEKLRADYDAVFLGVGLGGTARLGIEGEDAEGVRDAVDYIAALRQANDLTTLPVGRRVVVIGGGMTAIDIATQSKKLGAEDVTIVYRRGPEDMGASEAEQHFAQTNGVRIRHWAQPAAFTVAGGRVSAVEFERTAYNSNGDLVADGGTFNIETDMVFRAIGQQYVFDGDGLDMESGRIKVDEERRTSLAGVWAGGDCVAGGLDLTVDAVEDGKRAAASIGRSLRGKD